MAAAVAVGKLYGRLSVRKTLQQLTSFRHVGRVVRYQLEIRNNIHTNAALLGKDAVLRKFKVIGFTDDFLWPVLEDRRDIECQDRSVANRGSISLIKDIFLRFWKTEEILNAKTETIKLNMPSLSPTMEKGNIVKWHKKEGDTVSPGDVLCDIQTDKAIISMDTEETGVLAKILVPDNTMDVDVGTLIALLVEEGDDWKNVQIPADAAPKPQPTAAAAAASPPAPAGKPQPSVAVEHGHLMGPSVKKLLQEYNIESSAVPATGRSGALLKGDVLEYIQVKNLARVEQKAASPAPSAGPTRPAAAPAVAAPPTTASYVDIPLTNMRRTIAKRLTESKATIPHAYASIESDVGAVTELRKTLMNEGVKVSVNDFIIKAAALALQRVPRVNAIWANDGPQLSQTVDISVAVATPNGLITPIVKGATYLTVDQISKTVKELAVKARDGKLQLHEFQGGSFSISNLGMFGISEFTAVINLPQIAILAVGTSRPVATTSGNQHRMTVTMSYDSRAISEIEATQWLQEFRNIIENPKSMLSGTNLDAEAEAFAF